MTKNDSPACGVTMHRPPRLGQRFPMPGFHGIIRAIHAAGTIDVEAPSGRLYRVTGLPFCETCARAEAVRS